MLKELANVAHQPLSLRVCCVGVSSSPTEDVSLALGVGGAALDSSSGGGAIRARVRDTRD